MSFVAMGLKHFKLTVLAVYKC